MAVLEIDREDVHDRRDMEKECECYEEEVQPYRKTDYKPIIIIKIIVQRSNAKYYWRIIGNIV